MNSTAIHQKPLFNILSQKHPMTFVWTIQEDMKLITLCHQHKNQWAKLLLKCNQKTQGNAITDIRSYLQSIFRGSLIELSLVDKY